MREKLLRAWDTFSKVQRVQRSVERLHTHAEVASRGIRVGIGAAHYAQGIADDGPTSDELKDAAWVVACRGYDEARVAFAEHKSEAKRRRRAKAKAEAKKRSK